MYIPQNRPNYWAKLQKLLLRRCWPMAVSTTDKVLRLFRNYYYSLSLADDGYWVNFYPHRTLASQGLMKCSIGPQSGIIALAGGVPLCHSNFFRASLLRPQTEPRSEPRSAFEPNRKIQTWSTDQHGDIEIVAETYIVQLRPARNRKLPLGLNYLISNDSMLLYQP
ncbi:predicted protein [Histoplasma capsulatum var. duboisii H88]|uniref:Predicted protein n=1 Tax=Ajellomyces capsulatus (strain H88) TaxID=544711 RepID=F0UHM5_AJEC8|nr:predicted protein [Histoplasma capsulatum var. duboisii H88]